MIGVFDSGFGGLHVLKSVTTRLPQYGYIYLGDSARAPYGPRPFDEVHAFTKQGVDFLFEHGAQLVVLACNTASSEALRKIQTQYGEAKKVLGVLIPFAEATARATKTKRVGVIATEGTVRSGSFPREITKVDPEIEVVQQACPLLVPLVEAGEQDSAQAERLLEEYLRPLLAQKIDTLVLGCTHYGLLERKIQEVVGPKIEIITERDVVASSLKDYLARHPDIESKITKEPSVRFFSTGDIERFEKLGSIFFESPIRAEHVDLL
ncbi:glutamate racemase [Candidatus Kaiserbacteria bacterium RIFCSPHIGHO2_01_FULL_54_36]|uniref:Glutamate racemase n=1 Tax=Candidatus Kaiserbacteria bacterium RIFCSPHIGHO2_01_FULL_54_36 TaxID=1798482 RepID=A0A1F6CPL8_9BACT|nr:MAG: glutamate racemase [Candidatus Kaiserbacteria bacterium RIFCSPHIGHO2_01_FULL_54_36]OGG75915.1 MAG: glutamate racemase [Candidatus Kaiserbacteria bacterium RIFCSPLOWO2_01_FULL_54_22]